MAPTHDETTEFIGATQGELWSRPVDSAYGGSINGDHLARVSIDPADHPIHERKGDQQILWLRTPGSTIAVADPQEQDRIIARRWST